MDIATRGFLHLARLARRATLEETALTAGDEFTGDLGSGLLIP